MRRFLRFLIAYLVLLECSGCGSGSSTISASGPSGSGHNVSFQAIQGLISSKNNLDQDQGLVELTHFLVNLPDVVGSKLAGDGSVWALFDDGQLLVFVNNRRPAPPTRRDAPLPRADAQIPESDLAHFANTFEGSSTFRSPLPFLITQARFSGYRIGQGGGVEELRNLRSLGSLYIDAHGGSSEDASSGDGQTAARGLVLRQGVPRSFSIWTQTRASEELDVRYQDELRSKTLIHFIAPIDDQNYERRYGITGKFVRENWTFRPHSLVFTNACSSHAADFREACLEAGASAYLGWTLNVGDALAFDAAQALYSLLSPSTDEPPVSTLDEALARLAGLGFDLDPNSQARLKVTQTPSFGLLVPSLRSLTVVDDRIVLGGFFGSEPGQVLIDGSPVALTGDWAPVELILPLPETGTQLRIRVRGRLSNTLDIPRPDNPGTVGDLSFSGVGNITSVPSRPDLEGSPMNVTLTIRNNQVVGGVIDFGPPAGFTHFFTDQPGDIGPGVTNTLTSINLTSIRGITNITIPLPRPDQTLYSGHFRSSGSGEGTTFDVRGDFVYQTTSFSQP